uniref:Uncharacterized protein n=1 Tax=Oryza meridionalis TaxID=40149 RepID=A0A0E0EP21_9ORYZ
MASGFTCHCRWGQARQANMYICGALTDVDSPLAFRARSSSWLKRQRVLGDDLLRLLSPAALVRATLADKSFRARRHTPSVFLSVAFASGLVPPRWRLGLRLVGAPPAPQPRRREEARRCRPRTPPTPAPSPSSHSRAAAHHELRLPPPRAAKGKKRAAAAGFEGTGSPPPPTARASSAAGHPSTCTRERERARARGWEKLG